MLRCHPPPNEKKLQEVQAALTRHGLQVDISSAGALQVSLSALQRNLPRGMLDSISQLLLRTMNVRDKMVALWCWHKAVAYTMRLHLQQSNTPNNRL